jgi:hypothetical protein
MIATQPVQRVLDRLQKVVPAQAGWEALCPSHDDNRRSLCVGVGGEGRALIKCQAGCSTEAVLTALGLTSSDLFETRHIALNGNGKRIVKEYDYHGADGELRFQVVRMDPKDFRCRRPDGAGGWIWKMEGVERVVYRLPAVQEAVARGDLIYVTEGEKAADALVKLGVCATCTPGGAGKSHKTPSLASTLRGARVVLLPDNDEPGRKQAAEIAATLQGVASSVAVVALPGLPEKGDPFDWIAAGGTRESLEKLTTDSTREKPKAGSPVYRVLADVVPEEVRWLSPGRIPLGKITIVEGDPGLGKTMAMGDLAARVTRGEGLPGDPAIQASDVVILTGEDGVSDTIHPRLEAAGADMRRVKVMEGVYRDDGQGEGIVLPRDVGAVQQLVEMTAAKLVIVDVLNAFLDSSVDSYKDHDIRRALLPFKVMAEVTGAAVVLLRHLKKSGGSRAVAAGGGSMGIGGAARSVLLVGQDPADRENKRVLASVKCNLAPTPASLSFAIESTDTGVGRIRWLGQSTETADSLVADRAACDGLGDGESKLDEAVSLLEGWLASGEKDKKEVLHLGQDNGISNRTLERAANKLGVRREQRGFGTEKRSYWGLPTNPAIPPIAEKAGTIGDVGTIGSFQALTPMAHPSFDQSRQRAKPLGVGTIADEVLI